jgi:hypothetical protein
MRKNPTLEIVDVDTTVMEKNISFPTDGLLLHRVGEHLVSEA